MTATTEKTALDNKAEEELQLVRLMGDLVSLLEHEITVVEERLSEELPGIVARKQRLLMDYQAELKTANQEWLKTLPAPKKQLLRQMGEALRDASERNARVLKAAATATQRLLHGIMTSVRDEKCAPLGYQHLVEQNAVTPARSVLFKTTA